MDSASQLARLGLFDSRVPRYTSYPTAPQFAGGVGPDDFRTWIRAIPAHEDISLYLHVPFCRRLCWFCACRTQGTTSASPVAAYVEVLKAELAMLARDLAPGVRLSRLHWGGGTPTLMSAESITDLARAIAAVAPLAPSGEFSVEIDPNEVDDARLDALAAAGMNRASIGVQDFDPAIQRLIGREQSFEVTALAARGLRARGIRSLNADILYGLPEQTPDRITRSVEQLLEIGPDRVALYGYAHVPWMSRRQQLIPTDALPGPEARLDLFHVARELFLAAGYVQIGIDHFARPGDGLARAQAEGRLRRNFQGYTDDPAQALVGVGASSISRLPQGYAQNAAATGEYVRAIEAGHHATTRGHRFTDEDRLHGRLIEAVMCDFAISADELRRDFGLSDAALSALFTPVVARFEGLVVQDRAGLRIRPEGQALTRIIARAFDARDEARAAYSGAI